jgi:hypothetical protein
MFAALLSSLISEYQLRTEVAQKLGGILDTFYSWETYTIIYHHLLIELKQKHTPVKTKLAFIKISPLA